MKSLKPTDGTVNSKSHTDDGIRGRCAILVMDRNHDGTEGALAGWLGEHNAARLRAYEWRYVVVLSIDTGGNPRYVHNVEGLAGMQDVIDSLSSASRLIERIGFEFGLCSPGTPNACMADVRLRLDAGDTATVDKWLDECSRKFLLRTDTMGAS
jgi:hypothetical protein